MDKKLIEILAAAGKETATLDAPDGSQLLVLPYGGRVLGLYAPGDSRNFLWTNVALENADSARAFYASDVWKNSGGDRTWLSPEIDLFMTNFPANDVYYQPRALDPGNYTMEKREGAIHLAMDLSVTSYRHKRPMALRISKSVRAVVNPLHQERNLSGLEGIQFAGYALHTSLELVGSSDASPAVGSWSLLQLPHGGEMLLPTYGVAKPSVYFGQIPTGDLEVKPGQIRYRTRAKSGQKIGVSGVSSPGRLGYHYRKHEMSHLVVRNFSVNPSGDYIDVPWTDHDDLGHAVQICSVDLPELGAFTELEYHAPAIGGPGGARRVDDTSQVWAFRGSIKQMNCIAEKLLGISLEQTRN